MTNESTFSIDGMGHEIGIENCGACYYGGVLGPCRCGGMIHEQLIGLSGDDVFTTTKCDKCLQ